MKATINTNPAGIFNPNDRREKNYDGGYVAVAITSEGVRECVDLKLYTTASRAYCCVWFYGDGVSGNGSGRAGGYGYHRASAAALSAFRAAGVALDEDIAGRGDGAIRDAVEAIARALYPEAVVHVVHAHP